MGNIQKPGADVLRRNPENECGQPVGQLNVMIRGAGLQTISFYCNQPRLHVDRCRFEGADVVVEARRRADGANSINISSP